MANRTGEEWQSLEVKKKRATSVELAWQAKWNLASVYLDFFIHLMHPSGQFTVFIRKRPNLGGHWVKLPSFIPRCIFQLRSGPTMAPPVASRNVQQLLNLSPAEASRDQSRNLKEKLHFSSRNKETPTDL